ncbi:MAG: hypothetical protein LUF92_13245, partial [Clostridiales bacterium]|nr:hypothetical protein [Clostridiales bacterium]
MKHGKYVIVSALLALSLFVLCGCSQSSDSESGTDAADGTASSSSAVADSDTKEYIETTLNLANNEDQEWTYSADADAWTLSIVSAVAYPEIEDEQGVSVCVPGTYVTGIDTDADGTADVTSADYEEAVKGSLVIDYDAEITSTNGQVYTASTAPVILNTGAAGYSEQSNQTASSTYAAEGYINVACGNRGKQSTATDEDGNTYYTGDAPSCLVDQKNATRFVKYNILLGNLPGSVDYFVSTGGSGGGAHATMFAATSNNSDFYDYEIEAGAVGVYANEDGTYSTTVTIDGTDYELSDGAWGCIAYSAITSLYEGDMALAFEYYMDMTYDFNTSFQKQLAEYLSEAYMEYINEQELTVEESAVGFDLNEDGDTDDTVTLTIECDVDTYPETNGYYGTYLNLYLAEFTENLQWYLDNLDYADGWTWFDEEGNALSDDDVAAMTTEDKAQAFIEGRYTKGSSTGGNDGMVRGGGMGDGELPDGDIGDGELSDGVTGDDTTGKGNRPDRGNTEMDTTDADAAEDSTTDGTLVADGNLPDGDAPDMAAEGSTIDGDVTVDGNLPDGEVADIAGDETMDDSATGDDTTDDTDNDGEMLVGTPDSGTTQSASSSIDSNNYETYEEMVEAYKTDIEEISAGDEYGNNIVSLYNPLNYIGVEGTENPTWTRIVMGASEGDMSMFTSLNLQIAWLNAGVDAEIEWQWDGGHVPSEVLGESLALYVDQMYGEYVDGAVTVTKAEATAQTENGTSTEASCTDLRSWVDAPGIS